MRDRVQIATPLARRVLSRHFPGHDKLRTDFPHVFQRAAKHEDAAIKARIGRSPVAESRVPHDLQVIFLQRTHGQAHIDALGDICRGILPLAKTRS